MNRCYDCTTNARQGGTGRYRHLCRHCAYQHAVEEHELELAEDVHNTLTELRLACYNDVKIGGTI